MIPLNYVLLDKACETKSISRFALLFIDLFWEFGFNIGTKDISDILFQHFTAQSHINILTQFTKNGKWSNETIRACCNEVNKEFLLSSLMLLDWPLPDFETHPQMN
ncbi:CLUMA_CG011467, isoform A [Clunio marinus]|uniref:CLUMA_CG011467, isoform A n=1 Tax=Clunio marinus TaxID=568069 RepID=A0A1J1ID13_9DIPT|nr:CLUMA_CG011467, isoform A [Clunio marinus]